MELAVVGLALYAVGLLIQSRRYRRLNIDAHTFLRVACLQGQKGPLEYRGTVLQLAGLFMVALGAVSGLGVLPRKLVGSLMLVGGAGAAAFLVFGRALFTKRKC